MISNVLKFMYASLLLMYTTAIFAEDVKVKVDCINENLEYFLDLQMNENNIELLQKSITSGSYIGFITKSESSKVEDANEKIVVRSQELRFINDCFRKKVETTSLALPDYTSSVPTISSSNIVRPNDEDFPNNLVNLGNIIKEISATSNKLSEKKWREGLKKLGELSVQIKSLKKIAFTSSKDVENLHTIEYKYSLLKDQFLSNGVLKCFDFSLPSKLNSFERDRQLAINQLLNTSCALSGDIQKKIVSLILIIDRLNEIDAYGLVGILNHSIESNNLVAFITRISLLIKTSLTMLNLVEAIKSDNPNDELVIRTQNQEIDNFVTNLFKNFNDQRLEILLKSVYGEFKILIMESLR